METSSQEQLTAFGVFWTPDARLKTRRWNEAICRNQRVSQEIQAHLKCLQLRNEKAAVENVGRLCFVPALSVYPVNFRQKAKWKGFNGKASNQTLIGVLFHCCFYQFNHCKHAFAFSLAAYLQHSRSNTSEKQSNALVSTAKSTIKYHYGNEKRRLKCC